MKTKTQLSTAVLRDLREVGDGEAPTAEAAKLVEDAYDAKHAEWRRRGLAWWDNTGKHVAEIPLEAFQVVVDLMANETSGSLGRPEAPKSAADKREIEKSLLRDLRAMLHKPSSGEQTLIDLF